MATLSDEECKCMADLAASEDEQPLESLSDDVLAHTSLLMVQGFEERSVGLIEKLASLGKKVHQVIIGEYKKDSTPENLRYRKRLNTAAKLVAGKNVSKIPCMNNGLWVQSAIEQCSASMLVDVSSVSNRAMFAVLSEIAQSNRELRIGYTEAVDYWPTETEWSGLRAGFSGDVDQARQIDEKEWLYGSNFKQELMAGFEGYDSAGSSRALIAFLPFKSARLAAVMREEYAHLLFIAGQPHSLHNAWRYRALLEINQEIIEGRVAEAMPTFGYRQAATKLLNYLFREPGFLLKYNVHLAPLGSKLQEIACWIICRHIPGITVTTSVPTKYYPKAFSTGIGPSWVFRLGVNGHVNSPQDKN